MTCKQRGPGFQRTKHDDPGSPSGSSITRHRKQLDKLREQILPLMSLAFQFDSDISIVSIPRGLEVAVSQALKRSERFLRMLVLDVPSNVQILSGPNFLLVKCLVL